MTALVVDVDIEIFWLRFWALSSPIEVISPGMSLKIKLSEALAQLISI